MPVTEERVSGSMSLSINPRQPFLTPRMSVLDNAARRTTARITALSPGQSPPLVSIPTRLFIFSETSELNTLPDAAWHHQLSIGLA